MWDSDLGVGFLDGIGTTIPFSLFTNCGERTCAPCGGRGRVISLGLGGCRCGFWDAMDVMRITMIIPHGLFDAGWVFSFGVGAFGLRVCLLT